MSDTQHIFKDKLKAFLIHLAISSIILLIFFCLIYFLWYPSPLLKVTGGERILFLLACIDVILGPILTFVIYKKNKKTLKFDLAVIGFLQVVALLYGLHSLLISKPAWIVFNQNRFEMIQYNQIVDEDRGNSEFTTRLWSKPEFVAVELSLDASKRSDQVIQEVLTGISLAQQPKNYVSLISQNKQLILQSKPLKDLYNFNDILKLKKILSKYNAATGWVPLKTNGIDMVVLLNDNGEVIKIVDLRPWH